MCCCCLGAGSIDGLGECPLCDGHGSLAEFNDERPSMAVLEKIDLLDCEGSAFLLRHLLTSEESRNIIGQAEQFGLRSSGYNPRVRITDRVSIMGKGLAALLFERARPYLSDVEVWKCCGVKRPLGIRDDAKTGVWSPVGLNPCFRVCRYDPGGFFLPHKDGGFEYSVDHLSLKTFMVYLNDDFSGAPTSFYLQSQRHCADPDPSKVIYELHPETGSCVLFNHWLVHDGGVLSSGTKYILRTEVMYKWHGRKG